VKQRAHDNSFTYFRTPEATHKLGNTHLAYKLSRVQSLLFNFEKSQDYKEKKNIPNLSLQLLS